MGPMTLFDKSFLQSLSVDESVWFAHFFSPIVCPLFYVEAFADLEKGVRAGRTPEQEVGIIADKFPETSASPCPHHKGLAIGDLLGFPVPMNGQIPRNGGRTVEIDGKLGVVYDRSSTEIAFSRWHKREFLDIERSIARRWREELKETDLKKFAATLHVDATTCRTLEDARDMALSIVDMRDNPWERIRLAIAMLEIPRQYERDIVERWNIERKKSISKHSPYAAHVMATDLFFRFALAGGQISTERPSNRVDIAYLNYLPFGHIFVSNDTLHRRAAPMFLTSKQRFVWGQDLKADLSRINAHFMLLPDVEKERGIMAFAHAPPDLEGLSLVRELRAHYMGSKYDDRPPVKIDKDTEAKLVADIGRWTESAPFPESGVPISGNEDAETVVIKRSYRMKRGSWWQVPKGIDSKS